MEPENTEHNTRQDAIAALEEQLQIPLLNNQESGGPGGSKPPKPPGRKAIRRTCKGTAHLANLLPTGSVLAFQILSPAVTHQGKCKSIVSKSLTLGLLGLCGISCSILCFTDSFRDERGKVRYGVATWNGFRVIDGSRVSVKPEDEAKYKLKLVDFFHAFLSIIVFGAVALFDKNVVNCLYPRPSDEAQEYLSTLPVVAGIICSILFVVFPTRRHGIGFPLSRN